MSDPLDGLNPRQREAARTTEGPLLILAGAGTGKTRTLTARLAFLLAARKTWPSRILSVTFTNRAAREMRARAERLIGESARELSWLGTFHAMGARILRAHAGGAELESDFTILDADDRLRLIKQIAREMNLDEKRFPHRMIAARIDRWKDRGLDPDQTPKDESADPVGQAAARAYRTYQARLKSLNAADFGDLLMEPLRIFRRSPDVLAAYGERFEYILVDEYQDTNAAQYLWLRLLARRHGNICCVGDDDQSIYGWRGAEVSNIMRFEKDFSGAKVIRLEQNYRSTRHILTAASALIAHNGERLGKTLWTAQEGGEKIILYSAWSGEDEAAAVCSQITADRAEGLPLNEAAILVRASFQIRAFEERLLELKIPYRIIGGPRFYERAEVRDANAYLRLVHQAQDDLAFERIVNLPRRGIGQASVGALRGLAQNRGVSLIEAAGLGADVLKAGGVSARAAKSLEAFAAQVGAWREGAGRLPPADFAARVFEESGYLAMWRGEKVLESQSRLENLKELVRAIGEFESLQAYLDHVALVMEAARDESGDRVTVMTLHAAKGLEFDRVFLPGWEEGLFPHERTLAESGQAGLEEERRLAHVGLTRARARAWISFAAIRRTYGSFREAGVASRFISELPRESLALVERRVEAAPVRAEEGSGAFKRGTAVVHKTFGRGVVLEADGARLTIDFGQGGRKKIMADYVEKAV